MAEFLKKLCFSKRECAVVKKCTRNQSGSHEEWIEHRKGRLTASKHHDYFTKVNTIIKTRTAVPKPKTTPLVANLIYQGKHLDHVAAIQWVKCIEAEALKQFYALEATKHKDFNLEKSWVVFG